MKLAILLLASAVAFAQHEPRGRTTPDPQARFHSLCLVTRGIQTVAAACRIEDAPRAGYENFYRIEVMSPWMRLDAAERFEAEVTVAALASGSMRVVIAGWGHILMVPLDAEVRDAQRRASAVETPTGTGAETIRQGVTVEAVGEGQYTIAIDHVGRGW